jgi:hypothetical protein
VTPEVVEEEEVVRLYLYHLREDEVVQDDVVLHLHHLYHLHRLRLLNLHQRADDEDEHQKACAGDVMCAVGDKSAGDVLCAGAV